MKKIGILTLPIKTNYGGILQVYALQIFLKSLGYDAWFIKRRWNSERQPLTHKICKFFYHFIVIRKFNSFITSNIQPQTEVIDTIDKVKTLMQKGFYAFVVGSDQVWRMRYVYGADYNYFLDFTDGYDVKRISYAASFGVDYWDDDTPDVSLPIVKGLLGKFDAISVREKTGCDLCDKLFNVKAIHVLDPTLLLDKSVYIKNLNLSVKNEKYLGVYILDDSNEIKELIRKISRILSLPIKNLNQSTLSKMLPHGISEIGKPGVKSWLEGIARAKFVITDSFHGTAFSIIFEKQFLVLENKHRGNARFESLLDLFDLRDRLQCNKILDKDLLGRKIDYHLVNTIKRKKQEEAKNFIENNI